MAVFGTTDGGSIRSTVDHVANATLGEPCREIIFYEVSTALVFGLELASGRRVVLRVLPGTHHRAYLAATRVVQSGLAATGYPAPQPVSGPQVLGDGMAVVDEYLPAPEPVLHPSADHARALAHALAGFASRCDAYLGLHDLEHPLYPWPPANLWGPRMRPEVDLHARPAGAEWIDAIGRRALAIAEDGDGRRVVGHADWLPHNVRMVRGDIVAVYDWDSVAIGLEPYFVGKACVFGSAAQADTFVSDYGDARDAALNRSERRLAFAVAAWMLAFLARWEHSQASQSTYLRDHLSEDGERLLLLAAPA